MKSFKLSSTKYKKTGFKSLAREDATFHSTFISYTQIGGKLENNLNKLLKKRTVHVLHQTTVPTSHHWSRLQHTFRCFRNRHDVSGDSEEMLSFFGCSKFSVRVCNTSDVHTVQTFAINWSKIQLSWVLMLYYLYKMMFFAYKSVIVSPCACNLFVSKVTKITQYMDVHFWQSFFGHIYIYTYITNWKHIWTHNPVLIHCGILNTQWHTLTHIHTQRDWIRPPPWSQNL